ncbi:MULTISPECIES: sugar phosphate isomerase/epimerase [unclassified Chelatococcus]|uniref:sugar phosphate isomerase/epimerase family protein n=1 Tax=unclassified Chelatococcus TaxID=2638111 RepID=UPI0002DA4FAD|nr:MULTISPECIES: TIM barrel protein [unclassified Chelatococcus]ALA20257.1 xylose isomerase [Chelatococcus sp. CO-6]
MIPLAPALCSVTFRQLPPEEIVALARQAGLAAIEWGGDVHVPAGDVAMARHVRRITEEAGLLPASYGSYLYPPDHGLEDFRRVLDTCHALGSSNVRIWPGRRNRPSATYDAAERGEAAGLIRAMGELAGGAGISVSLEYHPNSLTDETGSAANLMDAIAHANVHLYWQPRPGLPLDEACEEIARIGTRVSHVHVFAWDGARRRYALADHAKWWSAVFAALPESRFEGVRYAMLEFVRDDAPEAFLADAATLRHLLDRDGRAPANA